MPSGQRHPPEINEGEPLTERRLPAIARQRNRSRLRPHGREPSMARRLADDFPAFSRIVSPQGFDFLSESTGPQDIQEDLHAGM